MESLHLCVDVQSFSSTPVQGTASTLHCSFSRMPNLIGFNSCKRGYIHIFCSISELQWANSGWLWYEEFFPLCWMFSGLSQFPWTLNWWVLSQDQWEQIWHVPCPGGPASTEVQVGSLGTLEPNRAHPCPGCFWTGKRNSETHGCSGL